MKIPNLEEDIKRKLQEENCTSLSRQRRYLVFPEGSSFQVVFDLTYPSVAIQGNAFMFGHTAAMAWELPSKPIFLDKNKLTQDETMSTTTTLKPALTHFERDRQAWHQPPFSWDYSEPPNYSDVFWTIINRNFQKNKPSETIRKSVAHHVQRRSRRELYGKIETLLNAWVLPYFTLSKNGKSCVLKAICQVRKLSSAKGNFWEEIMKAIFRPNHDKYPDEDHYDMASNLDHNCEEMYPNCEGHVLSNLFRHRIRK